MNKVLLTGRLTADIKVNEYGKGDGAGILTPFTVAVNNGKDDATFVNCVAFNGQAEFLEKYFKKGSRMMIIGRVHNNNYTNKDGDKVYGFNVLVEDVEFGRNRSKEDSSEE